MDPLTLQVREAAKLLGIGRNGAYEAIARGEIPALRFGNRIVVPLSALELMLQEAGKQKGGEKN